jgi:hypothetical protein
MMVFYLLEKAKTHLSVGAIVPDRAIELDEDWSESVWRTFASHYASKINLGRLIHPRLKHINPRHLRFACIRDIRAPRKSATSVLCVHLRISAKSVLRVYPLKSASICAKKSPI